MSDVERVSVTITVIGVEQVRGRGSLIGLAIVELDIAGVVLTLAPCEAFGSLVSRRFTDMPVATVSACRRRLEASVVVLPQSLL